MLVKNCVSKKQKHNPSLKHLHTGDTGIEMNGDSQLRNFGQTETQHLYNVIYNAAFLIPSGRCTKPVCTLLSSKSPIIFLNRRALQPALLGIPVPLPRDHPAAGNTPFRERAGMACLQFQLGRGLACARSGCRGPWQTRKSPAMYDCVLLADWHGQGNVRNDCLSVPGPLALQGSRPGRLTERHPLPLHASNASPRVSDSRDPKPWCVSGS